MSGIERFRTAQNSPDAGFEAALGEIQGGRKRGHWIWFVFPQLAGLGMSGAAQFFGIEGEDEAADFLRDPELRSRFLTIANAVAAQLRPPNSGSLATLMSSEIDARKVVSSLTLFRHVAMNLQDAEREHSYGSLVEVADDILAAAAAEGYPPCAYTLRQLRRTG